MPVKLSHLGKNISANLLSNGWSTALLLLLTPLYVDFLGVESYGLIGFYTSMVAILGILDTGISATAVREIAWFAARPEEKRNIPVLMRSLEIFYWGIVLILGLGLLLGAWLFGGEWFQTRSLTPKLVRHALLLMAVSMVVQVPSGLYSGGLIGLQRQVEFSALVALMGTVRGVGAILVLWGICPDIRVFFAWQIMASAIQTGVMRESLWRKIRLDCDGGKPVRFSREILNSIKGFAGRMTMITALSIIITQADKMILSRFVSLEAFGFYVLAWSVASGLSRISIPLTQAFAPHFTELVSKGDSESLVRKMRLASQLMSVLILPPAALIVLFPEPILLVWLGNPTVATGVAPILAVIVVGTVLSACSYPALSILYSRKQLGLVLLVHLFSMVFFLPLSLVMVVYYGVIGASFCWGLYGLISYIVYQVYGLKNLPDVKIFSTILQDFFAPCLISFAVAGVAMFYLNEVDGKAVFVSLLLLQLIVGWVAALLVCKELFVSIMEKMKWKMAASH